MVYTIKNSCIEVPELEYEDGAQTIFLYTRGREGNPPEELKPGRAVHQDRQEPERAGKDPGLPRLQ